MDDELEKLSKEEDDLTNDDCDDDYDEAMLGTLALASPTIINEALATKNAFAMMKDAGMPANMGQKARLAGALLSYIGAPLVAGATGTAIGNIFDENVPTQ